MSCLKIAVCIALTPISVNAWSNPSHQSNTKAQVKGLTRDGSPESASAVELELPTFSTSSYNNQVESLQRAEEISLQICQALLTDYSLQQLQSGPRSSDSRLQKWLKEFPKNMVETDSRKPLFVNVGGRFRENSVHCRKIEVQARHWELRGSDRMIDSPNALKGLLGLFAGDRNLAEAGKFGAYAALQTTCVPRPAEEIQDLLEYRSCLQFERDIFDAGEYLQIAIKNAKFKGVGVIEDATKKEQKILDDLKAAVPKNCGQRKLEIEAKGYKATQFAKVDGLRCERGSFQ